MSSAKNTAIYAQEAKVSKNKDDLVFMSYDFMKIIKKMILENSDCLDKSLKLEYNDFTMKADILCENNITLIDIFNSYQDTSFSHRLFL